MSLANKIWEAIQRPSPAVSYAEISALVDEWTAVPVADESEDLPLCQKADEDEIELTSQQIAAVREHVATINRIRSQSNDSLRGSQWTEAAQQEINKRGSHRLTVQMAREAARRAKEYDRPIYSDGDIVATIPAGTLVTKELIDDIEQRVFAHAAPQG